MKSYTLGQIAAYAIAFLPLGGIIVGVILVLSLRSLQEPKKYQPNPPENVYKSKIEGTFELDGSTCRIVTIYNEYYPNFTTRFVLCDPPLPGMIQGTKPSYEKGR